MNLAEQLRILETAHGNPALLALATVDLGYPALPADERQQIRAALIAASLPHWCDPPYLAALLDLPIGEGERLLDRLRPLTVIEPFRTRGPAAVDVHEAARLALREHLRTSDATRWTELSSRAHRQVASGTEAHARIEAVYHLFAIDKPAAAAACEALDRDFLDQGREESRLALALAMQELTTAGWLDGPALVEALLAQYASRVWRGESAQLEAETRRVVDLARDAAHPWGVARGLDLLGDALLAKGQLDMAADAYEESLDILMGLAKADPAMVSYQRDLAAAHVKCGDIAKARGNLASAARSYDHSLRTYREIAARDPSDSRYQRDVGAALGRVGDAAAAQGHLDDAQAAYQQYQSTFESLVSIDANNTDWVRELAVANGKVGEIARTRRRLDDALTAFRKALALFTGLTARDPTNVLWQREVAVAHSQVGDIVLDKGDLDAATSSFRESLAIADRLSRADPHNTTRQRDLAFAHMRLGTVAKAQQRFGEALAAFSQSLAIATRLAAADPSNVEWRRDLAFHYNLAGQVRLELGQKEQARADFSSSVREMQRVVEASPAISEWQQELDYLKSWVGRDPNSPAT